MNIHVEHRLVFVGPGKIAHRLVRDGLVRLAGGVDYKSPEVNITWDLQDGVGVHLAQVMIEAAYPEAGPYLTHEVREVTTTDWRAQ